MTVALNPPPIPGVVGAVEELSAFTVLEWRRLVLSVQQLVFGISE